MARFPEPGQELGVPKRKEREVAKSKDSKSGLEGCLALLLTALGS